MAKQCRNCGRLKTDYEWGGEEEDETEYCECSMKKNPRSFVESATADCQHAKEYKDMRRRSWACHLWEILFGGEDP